MMSDFELAAIIIIFVIGVVISFTIGLLFGHTFGYKMGRVDVVEEQLKACDEFDSTPSISGVT